MWIRIYIISIYIYISQTVSRIPIENPSYLCCLFPWSHRIYPHKLYTLHICHRYYHDIHIWYMIPDISIKRTYIYNVCYVYLWYMNTTLMLYIYIYMYINNHKYLDLLHPTIPTIPLTLPSTSAQRLQLQQRLLARRVAHRLRGVRDQVDAEAFLQGLASHATPRW